MEKNIKWQPIIELIIVLVTVLGSTITLYVHTDNKMTANITEMRTEFNQQLAKQDLKFAQQNDRFAQQNDRSDKLYEILIDMLKNRDK